MTKPKTPPAGAATSHIGAGGELHQTASAPEARMTTNFGVPISDHQNSLKAGARGPSTSFRNWPNSSTWAYSSVR